MQLSIVYFPLRDTKLWENHNFLLSHWDRLYHLLWKLWQPVSSTLKGPNISVSFSGQQWHFTFFQILSNLSIVNNWTITRLSFNILSILYSSISVRQWIADIEKCLISITYFFHSLDGFTRLELSLSHFDQFDRSERPRLPPCHPPQTANPESRFKRARQPVCNGRLARLYQTFTISHFRPSLQKEDNWTSEQSVEFLSHILESNPFWVFVVLRISFTTRIPFEFWVDSFFVVDKIRFWFKVFCCW